MYFKMMLLLLARGQIWAAPTGPNDDHEMHPYVHPVKNSVKINTAELNPDYWKTNAQQTIRRKIDNPSINKNVAKNVILFLGDGMSVPTLAAARVYLRGEEAQLSFDKFPYVGLSKTYAVDRQVADSASTATAYLCGVKANYGTMGVSAKVPRSDCKAQADKSNHVYSIAHYSQLKNKKTGLVTTARVTHASPGGVYAHIADREWESDTKILSADSDPSVCTDIATQLVNGETGKNLNVILGGGTMKFLPKEVKDDRGVYGERTDGVNLLDKWMKERKNAAQVWNRDQLLNLDKSVENLLGLFSSTHLDYNVDRNTNLDPSLAEMTEAAIKILSRGGKGYFLFVEGARIDMGHHGTQAHVALDETIEFSKAVQTAVDLTNKEDTLIVVTSDHSHTMTYSGYPSRGNNIFSFAGNGSDGIVYSTLSYANGAGYREDNNGTRYDPSSDDYNAPHHTFPALVPIRSETHGGDDVGIFARGPWAHLLTGVLEQNVIPHVMSFASCVGPSEINACNMETELRGTSSAEIVTSSLVVIILLHLLI